MSERRQEVLEALRASETPMSILAIARQLGLHPNTVRFHLQALAKSGRVEQVEQARTSPGRPALMFRAHRGMDPAGPRNYQFLADALATRLGAESESSNQAVDAGRDWGLRLFSVDPSGHALASNAQATNQLIEMLEDLGFSPQLRSSEGETQIALRHCPFLDLVPQHQDVICPLHLGLMQGAMAAMNAGISVERLVPFAEPDLCLAHLSPSAIS